MAQNLPPGLPENWAKMTPAEKREYRLNRFMNPGHIKFVSPEAEKAYKARARRIVNVFNVEEPDRLPVSLPVGHLPFNLYGIRMHDAVYDVEKGIRACRAFNEKYSEDLDHFAVPFTIPGKAGTSLPGWGSGPGKGAGNSRLQALCLARARAVAGRSRLPVCRRRIYEG